MQLDDVANDGQAEAETAAGALQRLVALHEALEDLADERRRNAVAVVVDGEHRAAALAPQDNADAAARAGELGGVGEQVADHLRQPHRIAVDPQRLLGHRQHRRRRPASHRRLRLLEGAHGNVAQVDSLSVQLDLAGGDARDIEQVVDESRQVPDLALDDVPLRRGDSALPARHQLERGDDRRQRVAQLVAEHGQEFVLDAAGRFGLREGRPRLGEQAHVVEREGGTARDLADEGNVVGLEAAPRLGLDHRHRADRAAARDQRHHARRAQADDAHELGDTGIGDGCGGGIVVEVGDEGLAGRDRPREGAGRGRRRHALPDPAGDRLRALRIPVVGELSLEHAVGTQQVDAAEVGDVGNDPARDRRQCRAFFERVRERRARRDEQLQPALGLFRAGARGALAIEQRFAIALDVAALRRRRHQRLRRCLELDDAGVGDLHRLAAAQRHGGAAQAKDGVLDAARSDEGEQHAESDREQQAAAQHEHRAPQRLLADRPRHAEAHRPARHL